MINADENCNAAHHIGNSFSSPLKKTERELRRNSLRKSIEESEALSANRIPTVANNRFGEINNILGTAKSLVTDLNNKLSSCTPVKSGTVRKIPIGGEEAIRGTDHYTEAMSTGHKPSRPHKRQETAAISHSIAPLESSSQENSSTSESNLQEATRRLREFELEQIPKYKAAYLRMRRIVPINIDKLSIDDLCGLGLPRPVAKRIWSQKTIWFLVMHTDDISKIHIADLRGKFQFKDLDIVELRAVWYCLVDIWRGSCPKAEWKEDFKRKLNQYAHDESLGNLSYNLLRNPAYLSFEPIDLVDPLIEVTVKYSCAISTDPQMPEQNSLRDVSASYSNLDDIDLGPSSRYSSAMVSSEGSPTLSEIDIDFNDYLTCDDRSMSPFKPHRISVGSLDRHASPERKPQSPSPQKGVSPPKKALQQSKESLVLPLQPLPTLEEVKSMLVTNPGNLKYFFLGRFEYSRQDFQNVFNSAFANNWLLECMTNAQSLVDPLETLISLIGEMDANVNITDSLGQTPLMIWLSNEEVGRYLVLMGADIFRVAANNEFSALEVCLQRRYFWLFDALQGSENEKNLVGDPQRLYSYVEALIFSGRSEHAEQFISTNDNFDGARVRIPPAVASDMMTKMSAILAQGAEGLLDPIGTFELLTKLGAIVEL